VLAVWLAYQFGIAELADNLAAVSLRPDPTRRGAAAQSFTCAGRITPEPSGCWAIAGKWIRFGSTGWREPRWIWRPIESAAIGCADMRRRQPRNSGLT
jgi:hypothetical protein